MPDSPADKPNRPDQPNQPESTAADTPADADAPLKRKAFEPSAETKPGNAPSSKQSKKSKKQKPEPTTLGGKLWHNWIKPIGTVVIVVVVFRSMLLDWNDVPSGSMEPEIHVGDRVAVNRLAYALQLPVSGPTIEVPFLGRLSDNPLDFLPQFQYAQPKRGDIVTFWNPVSDIRMIKRIVAVPGDRIEMRNSQMIINGTTATYDELDAAAEGLPPITSYSARDPRTNTTATVTEDVIYRRESLLEQQRVTQHITERWADLSVELPLPGARNKRLEIRSGEILVDGSPASYNAFAEARLRPFTQGPYPNLLDAMNLGIDGDRLIVDGQKTHYNQFYQAFVERAKQLTTAQQRALIPFNEALGQLQGALATSFGPITLGDDEYLMIGDNRNNSSDGRHFGPVHRDEITGRAFAVAFSFEDNKMFALPPRPAWSRFFKDLD